MRYFVKVTVTGTKKIDNRKQSTVYCEEITDQIKSQFKTVYDRNPEECIRFVEDRETDYKSAIINSHMHFLYQFVFEKRLAGADKNMAEKGPPIGGIPYNEVYLKSELLRSREDDNPKYDINKMTTLTEEIIKSWDDFGFIAAFCKHCGKEFADNEKITFNNIIGRMRGHEVACYKDRIKQGKPVAINP